MAVHLFLYRFKRIKVYALIGQSGSGKSFRSRSVIEKHNIDLLIDDGLIIKDDKILSGRTAKNADNILDAVGTAIFEDKQHRNEARVTLEKHPFSRVLVLGTSEKMIRRICGELLLPAPAKIIRIEDIASQQEIDTARAHRNHHGSHVVPVPAFELQRSFPDMLVSSLKVLFQKGYGFFRKNYIYQKSIVRPVYSGKGVIKLSEGALLQLVSQSVQGCDSRITVSRVRFYPQDAEYAIEVYVIVPSKKINLTKILPRLQDSLITEIQNFSGILVRKLDVIIDKINDEHT